MKLGIKVAVIAVIASVLMGLSVMTSGGASPLQREAINWHAQTGMSGATGGTATLVRNSTGVSYQINATHLKPGHVYTVWFVVVNDPAACTTTPCLGGDILVNAGPDAQVSQGGGGIAGVGGELGFGGNFPVGELKDGWIAGRGLENPMGAEIHLVINDHGPVIFGMEHEMVSTYRAGCTDASLPGIFPPTAISDGTPGPNTCQLFQVAIFE